MRSNWSISASRFAAFRCLQSSKSASLSLCLEPPGYKDGKLAIGDFPAQMKQVMDNHRRRAQIGRDEWDRVVKTNVMLTRSGDFDDTESKSTATYFPDRKHPARTTVVVAGLPSPDFLLE